MTAKPKPRSMRLKHVSLPPFPTPEAEGDLLPHSVRPGPPTSVASRGACPGCKYLIEVLNSWRATLEEHLEAGMSLREGIDDIGATQIQGIEVSDTDPSDGQRLTYDSATGKIEWETP